MFRVYKILTRVVFIYTVAHLLYPLFDRSELTSADQVMWFLSGGMAMFFNGCINLIHLVLKNSFTRLIAIITNAVMLFFLIVLCVVIPEIQVFILTFILLLILIMSAKAVSTNVGSKRKKLKSTVNY